MVMSDWVYEVGRGGSTIDHAKSGAEDWNEGDGLRVRGEDGGGIVVAHACLRLSKVSV